MSESDPIVDRIGRSWAGVVRDVVMIVVSILIAFALDAWWDGLGRADHERQALIALAAEIRGAQIELDSVTAINRERVEASRYFLSLRSRSFTEVPSDSVAFALGILDGGMTFDPSTGATEAILTGGLELMTDAELRANTAAWPGMLQEIEVDQAVMVDRWEKLSDALIEAGVAQRLYTLADGNSPLLAERRALAADLVQDEHIAGRVAALGGAIGELLEELREVRIRLEELATGVEAALESSGVVGPDAAATGTP